MKALQKHVCDNYYMAHMIVLLFGTVSRLLEAQFLKVSKGCCFCCCCFSSKCKTII